MSVVRDGAIMATNLERIVDELEQSISHIRMEMQSNATDVTQQSILSARESVERWEQSLHHRKADQTETEIHEMTIRYAKGFIKLWRIWLTKQPPKDDN